MLNTVVECEVTKIQNEYHLKINITDVTELKELKERNMRIKQLKAMC